MKYTLAFVLLLVTAHTFAQQKKILWIGNSYVTVNDLPTLFSNLARSGGDTIIYDSNAPGGTTLQGHAGNATTIQKIYSQQWDYVIVQAQSQEPSFPPAQVQAQTFPYARILDSLIHDNNPCTQTVFYMTWGKKYGDQMNCANYAILCTFEGVTARLRESYLQMADDNRALVAPAGVAWQTSWHTDTTINLWNPDNSHPSIEGSYLTACTFYETIFGKSPVGLSYSPLAQQGTTTFLQTVAHQTVYDSASQWNIGEFTPNAEFDFTGNAATRIYTFNNLSQNATSYQWLFGDGTNSTATGSHTYAATGTYTVTLIAADSCGRTDTARQTFTIEPTTGINDLAPAHIAVYPNPLNGNALTIETTQPAVVVITDVLGKEVYRLKVNSGTTIADVTALETGMYLVAVNSKVIKLLKL